jgi:hypothetical protein
MDIEEGGLEMINLFSFVKSKQIKVLYIIMHSGNKTWSALGKYWLKKFDKDTGEDFFLCKCLNNHLKPPFFYIHTTHVSIYLVNFIVPNKPPN